MCSGGVGMRKLLLAWVAVAGMAGPAAANVISTDVTIAASLQPGSVQQLLFSVSSAGAFQVDALGSGSLGAGFNSDPQIFLFINDGSLDAGDLLATDDDGGAGLDSRILINLGVGGYILAVSEFFFDVNQAISGIDDSIGEPNTRIRIAISSNDGVAAFAQVPAPATVALLGVGLLALRVTRRRKL